MSEEQSQPERHGRLSQSERTKIRDRFGRVLFLLLFTVFFSIAAPDQPWAWLATSVVLATNLRVAMLASGVRPVAVGAWTVIAVLHVGASIFITSTLGRSASGYLAITTLLLTLVTIGAIAWRLWLQPEISLPTVLGAVCIYVLLGLSFAFVYEAIGTLGPQPFFATQEGGTRSDYMYFSFITMATVGYGDLTPVGGLGRALAVMEGMLGQIYLVTAVAALVGNLGRTRVPQQARGGEALEGDGGTNGGYESGNEGH